MKDLSLYKPARVWLLLVTLSLLVSRSYAFKLTILHTNDVHSRVEQSNGNGGPCGSKDATEGNCFGGFARISTMVKAKRAAYPGQSILLDGGDQFQGTLWHYVFGGMISAHFMNLVGYDAMALGNHEFDSGPEGLLPFLETAEFPVLSSNVDFSPTPKLQPYVNKSTILLVSGQKIGVVGYTTADTVHISSPGPIAFNEVTSSVQREVDILTAQGINKIIAVGHAGFVNDLAMAKQLKNVDVVVGGHTNTFLYTGDPPSSEKPVDRYPVKVTNDHGEDVVLVVQDYAYGKYLGELHVEFDDQGKVIRWSGNPVLLNSSVNEDADILKVVEEKLANLTALKMSVIGQSLVELQADVTLCRARECNLGNLVTDALVRQFLRSSNGSWTEAGIALINGGGIRAPIFPGPITVEHVLFVFPFRNTVDMVELSGKTIMAMLEYGAAQLSAEKRLFGGFFQVSGMQITYDLRRPVGKRVVQALAVCTQCVVPKLEPLDTNKNYKVLMLNFIKNGGNGYDMILPNIVSETNTGALDSDILAAHIKDTSPIATGLEGRIRFLDEMEGVGQLIPGCLDSSSHVSSSLFALVCSLVSVLALRV